MKIVLLRMLHVLSVNPTNVRMISLALIKKIQQFIDRKRDAEKIMVNIGGLRFFKRHWKVLDYRHPESRHYDSLGIDINHDLLSGKKFPWDDHSVSFFTSAHTLEHLLDPALPHIFREMYRCLKPGGAVRVTVPDYDYLYDCLLENDDFGIMNSNGSAEYYRYLSACEFYGTEIADRMFPSPQWPRSHTLIEGPFTKQQVADRWVNQVATHREGEFSYDELQCMARQMGREQFGDFLTHNVTMEYKRRNPGSHNVWFNYEKMAHLFKEAGFELVYKSAPNKSKFDEFRGVGKYWGFDWRRMETSLYVEAVAQHVNGHSA